MKLKIISHVLVAKVSSSDTSWFLEQVSKNVLSQNVTNWGSYLTYKKKEYGPFKKQDELIEKAKELLKRK